MMLLILILLEMDCDATDAFETTASVVSTDAADSSVDDAIAFQIFHAGMMLMCHGKF